MKALTVVAIFLLSGCSLNRKMCASGADLSAVLPVVSSSDWENISPAEVRTLWLRGPAFESHADDPPGACNGTTSLAYKRYERDRCACCETFVFDHVPRTGTCGLRLTTLSIFLRADDRMEAFKVAETLLMAAAPGSIIREWSTHPYGIWTTALDDRMVGGSVERITATVTEGSEDSLINVMITRNPR